MHTKVAFLKVKKNGLKSPIALKKSLFILWNIAKTTPDKIQVIFDKKIHFSINLRKHIENRKL